MNEPGSSNEPRGSLGSGTHDALFRLHSKKLKETHYYNWVGREEEFKNCVFEICSQRGTDSIMVREWRE